LNLPAGYRYSATYAGIRKDPHDDLALIVSDTSASVAAVFTQNRVQASPVKVARAHLLKSQGVLRAVLVNAGNANCATRTGDAVAEACCEALAAQLGVPADRIFPASTGVIGVELDASLIIAKLPGLVAALSPDRFEDVARAIMTTDTRMKTASAAVEIGGKAVSIAGMTKGSGMIHPNMATTLGFLFTDATVAPMQIKAMLAEAAARSYNRISVDGDTSTNDTLALVANGASGVQPAGADRVRFQQALDAVAESLAEQIVRDGEGARKLIRIEVSGAADEKSAVRIGRAIANSPLFKTAIAGSDPNWGRILSAAGNSGVVFDPGHVDIWLQGTAVCQDGLAAEFSEEELKKKLDKPECLVRFVIGGPGRGEARFLTCDLTEKYIEINASYRT
jgi:glutamate N-acetyltransferase / amino-acid N-acetyltransferase